MKAKIPLRAPSIPMAGKVHTEEHRLNRLAAIDCFFAQVCGRVIQSFEGQECGSAWDWFDNAFMNDFLFHGVIELIMSFHDDNPIPQELFVDVMWFVFSRASTSLKSSSLM